MRNVTHLGMHGGGGGDTFAIDTYEIQFSLVVCDLQFRSFCRVNIYVV